MLSDINIFAKLSTELSNPAPFKVEVKSSIDNQHNLNIVADGVSVNVYLSKEQLEQVFGTINNYLDKLDYLAKYKVTA